MAAEAALPGGLHPRLPRIDLPRMDVDDGRLALAAIHPAHSPAQVAVGKHAEVGAAAERQVASQERRRRDRKLHEAPPVALANHVREALRVGHSVERVADRKDARIVAESQVEEDVRRPCGAPGEGERRRAIAEDRVADDVLERLLRALHVVAKLLARLLVDDAVSVPVGRHLVARGGDATHDRRMALGVPRQHEKRAVTPRLGEQREDRVRVPLDARLVAIPIGERDHRVEIGDLIPVLDVDGKSVHRRSVDGIRHRAVPSSVWSCPEDGTVGLTRRSIAKLAARTKA